MSQAIPVDPRELAKAQAADGAAAESAPRGPDPPPARPDQTSPATRGQEVTTQPDPTRAGPGGFAGYVSEHRFGLLMLLCALALALMLATVYGTVGFVPFWARFDVPAG